MPKKRILWVVYDFIQAGGQRYVYEICKALDKNKYVVDVLRVAAHGRDKNWDKEFYYHPTLDLGSEVFFMDDLFMEHPAKKLFAHQRLANRVVKKVRQRLKTTSPVDTVALERERLTRFFSGYDSINFGGVAVYRNVCTDRKFHPEHSIIHILTASFQEDQHLYETYDRNLPYHFVSPIIPASIKVELKEFTNYRYDHFPLCFETVPYDLRETKGSRNLKIAVFTRLSAMKPLDPYFYALKLLREQGVDAELVVYGAGSPEALGYPRQLKYLYLSDKVSFRGHTESIPDTLQNDQPDLVWFQSANGQPAGYAAFEISMSGLPQVFWDFMDIGQTHEISKVFKSFSNMTSFVQYSSELLSNQERRKEEGAQQRAYAIEHYSIKKHIHILEEIYDAG